MSKKRRKKPPRPEVHDLGDTEVKYGGRTAVVTVYMNTAASKEALERRFRRLHRSPALRGSKMDMAVTTVEIYTDPTVCRGIWQRLKDGVRSALGGKEGARS